MKTHNYLVSLTELNLIAIRAVMNESTERFEIPYNKDGIGGIELLAIELYPY